MSRFDPVLEQLADAAIAYFGAMPEELERFMLAAGFSPDSLRAALAQPDFGRGVADYVVSNESVLLAVCANANLRPETVMAHWQRQNAHL